MIINAESLPQVIEVAQGVKHLKLDNTKEYPSLSWYVTYSYMFMYIHLSRCKILVVKRRYLHNTFIDQGSTFYTVEVKRCRMSVFLWVESFNKNNFFQQMFSKLNFTDKCYM